MVKTLPLIVAGALAVAAPSQALAQTFWPRNSTTVMSGELYIENSIGMTCYVEIEVEIDALGQADITDVDFSPGDFYCSTVAPSTVLWLLVPDGLASVDFRLAIGTLFGDCQGTLQDLPFDAHGELTIDNETLGDGSTPCLVDGHLYAGPITIG